MTAGIATMRPNAVQLRASAMPAGSPRRVASSEASMASSALRRALVLGFLVRMPVFTGGIVLTLHVVSALDRPYAAAGLSSGTPVVFWDASRIDRSARTISQPCTTAAANSP